MQTPGAEDFGFTFSNYDNPTVNALNRKFHIDIKPHVGQYGYLEGLSKPAVNSNSGGRLFICGSENQSQMSKNFLLLGKIEADSTKLLKIQGIDEHVRYLEWLPRDPRRIVAAMNGELGIIVLNQELTDIMDIEMFPKFHSNTIRQFAVNPMNQSLVISGGFDAKVFVTDISKLVDDIQGNVVKSENSVYNCQDVVSSVRFHPSDANVASATTDQGVLHVFDVRTGYTSKPAFVYDTGKIELFTHAYLDDFTVCLGYGDGFIQVHDIRSGKTLLSFQDKCLQVVGDFYYETNRKLLISLGIPKYSIYQVNATSFELYNSAPIFPQQPSGNTHGTYIPQHHQLLTTDTFGNISLFDL